MRRKCSKCTKQKPIGDFSNKGKRKQYYCKNCQKAYVKKHYLKNKGEYIKKARAYEAKMREVFNALKNKPCMDCGIAYPSYVMDFDHRDEEIKKFTIGGLLTRIPYQKLLDEIAKWYEE